MALPGSPIDWKVLRGVVAVYKPAGPTSHDIVNRLRWLTGERRIGHAGTLDPFANGVLVVAIGREATKTIDAIVKTEKEYLATLCLGATSTTDDRTGKISEIIVNRIPTRKEVEDALGRFVGTIEQVPPVFSAIKKQGVKAYKKARRGAEVALDPRTVVVCSAELVSYDWPMAVVKFVTGPGVYIRAIARDLGEALCVGGYVESLRRLRVGTYDIDQALRLPPHPKDRD